jgi:glycerophosphoryl diester phosphodiesterase
VRAAGLLAAGLACLAADSGAAPPRSVIIAAHRGLSESVPENTLAAFRRSIARGVPIIELDLRVTADGELVVLHDRTLDRTTDCTGKVSAMALARVEACGVPTFAEVVALVRGTPVRILADVKTGTPLAPALEAIREQHGERQVILGLRSIDHVARARAALPETTILAFMPRLAEAPAFAAAGAHIIRLWSDWVEADPALVARTRALGPQVWILVGRRLPKTLPEWRALHGRMLQLGPDGLITDRPEWMPEAAR